jgi:hypothetical protein
MPMADPGFWGKRAAPWAGLLLLAGLLAELLAGCVPNQRTPSWAIYPLPRRGPHDGLAVVSQPDGYGLHIWIETDSRRHGICQPRWTPDAARLFNGNGTAPFSAGLVPRQEFFDAVARQDVRRALRAESEALCKARAPQRRYRWQEPPRLAQEVKAERFPLLEQPELLSDPNVIDRSEQRLLNGGS